MKKSGQFGEIVEGYTIPVFNEREIRAAAGILFMFAFSSILTAILQSSFLLLKYFVIAFLIDFAIRLFQSQILSNPYHWTMDCK